MDATSRPAVRRVIRCPLVGAVLTAALLLTGGPASAVRPAPELVASPASVLAGDAVGFTGRGFTVPPVESCEVRSSAAAEWGCSLDGHAYGSLLLASDLPAGTYDVLVCAPTCASPWAGTASGRVTVLSDGEPQEASGATATLPDGVELTPTVAGPGDEVFVEAASVPSVTSDCVAEWADQSGPAGTCALDRNGVVSGVIAAPDAGATGERTLVVCWPTCVDPVGGTASAVVTVRSRTVASGTVIDAPSPTTEPASTAAGPAGGIDRTTAPVVTTEGGRTTTVLLALLFAALLALVAAVVRWTVRRPPLPPALRLVADPRPSLVVTHLQQQQGPAAPTVRVRGVPDSAPTIALEVSP